MGESAWKSTVSIHLAVFYGAGTVLVDCDRQQSSSKWDNRREQAEPAIVGNDAFTTHGPNAIAQMARDQGAKTVIFDGQPRADALLRSWQR